jgi:hypothetical protein
MQWILMTMEKQGSKAQGKTRRVGFKDSGEPAFLPVSSVKERKEGKLLCGGNDFSCWNLAKQGFQNHHTVLGSSMIACLSFSLLSCCSTLTSLARSKEVVVQAPVQAHCYSCRGSNSSFQKT